MTEHAPKPASEEAPKAEKAGPPNQESTEPVAAPEAPEDKAKAASLLKRLRQGASSGMGRVITPTGANTLKPKGDDHGHGHHGGLGDFLMKQPFAIFGYFFTLIGRGLKNLPSLSGKGGGGEKKSGGDHGGHH